jgi:hypothetical protein
LARTTKRKAEAGNTLRNDCEKKGSYLEVLRTKRRVLLVGDVRVSRGKSERRRGTRAKKQQRL